MVPSLETNQAKYDTKTKHSLLLQMALESNPHVSFNKLILTIYIFWFFDSIQIGYKSKKCR